MAARTADAICADYNVSRESRAKLNAYVQLLLDWQAKINLIGPSTVDTVWSRHIEDALQLLPLLPPATKTVADLGSGAGIPGLVLAIAGSATVHLYESNHKKAAFLREAIRITHARAVVHPVRVEAAQPPDAAYDVVTARALAPLPKLLDLAYSLFGQRTVGLFLKGQDVDAELTEATKCWRIKFVKHPSKTDSKAVILEIREIQPSG